jgi:hypothetical protein
MASGPLGALLDRVQTFGWHTLSELAGSKATLGWHPDSRPISNSHNAQISCAIEVMATHK